MKNFTRISVLLFAFVASAALLMAQNAPSGFQTKAEVLGLEQTSPDYVGFQFENGVSRDIILEEGFDFDFPPAGWVVDQTHPADTWIQTNPSNADLNFDNIDPTSLFSAMVPWDDVTPQDEWLITPEISATEGPVILEYYFGISGPWLTGATLKAHITTDGGDSWTELMDAIDEVDPSADWAWYHVEMDITDFAEVGPFHVAWQYVGIDGDLCGLDGVSISVGGDMLYWDDFESYDLGTGIVENNDNWIIWPGYHDAIVVDEQANSPSQSIKITTEGGLTDVVLLLGNKTSGKYQLDANFYIPTGFAGYYNIQHFEDPGVEWAYEVYFAQTGDGWMNAGGANAAFFEYPKDTWFEMNNVIDLDEDWAQVYIDGVLIHEWQFSLQAQGQPGTKMLGGMNIFAGAPTGETPEFYVDDIAYYVLTPGSADPSLDMNTAQIIVQVEEGNTQTVNRTITNMGESTLVYNIVPTFNEPTRAASEAKIPAGANGKGQGTFELAPNATPASENPAQRDVTLNYDGENTSAIGLTNGGEYRVAARFPASMVGVYNGMYLTEVMVYINDMPNATKLQVYGMGDIVIPGAGELLHEQDFTPVAASWNTIVLDDPVYVDGQDLWIGYWIDEPDAGTFTAGCDDGPPIPDGRWISTGPGWGYLSETLPYNWNIRGLLTGEAGSVWLSTSPNEGEIEAAESENVEILVDASGMAPEVAYSGKLHIRSNDPANNYFTINVTMAVLVGLNEMGEQAYVKTYPNPASDMLTVKANTEITKVSVSNMLGQLVYNAELNTRQTVVDLSTFEAGMYLIKIETLNGTTTQKVMVK